MVDWRLSKSSGDPQLVLRESDFGQLRTTTTKCNGKPEHLTDISTIFCNIMDYGQGYPGYHGIEFRPYGVFVFRGLRQEGPLPATPSEVRAFMEKDHSGITTAEYRFMQHAARICRKEQ